MKSIEVKHLSYRYSADTELVLQDVSFNVAAGQWIAIVGHNGSGKSTLTKNLNGLLAPTSGEVVINGTTLTEDSVWDIRKQIGIVFQNPDNQFVGATVEDDVAFGLENRQIPHDEMHRRVKKALSDVAWPILPRESQLIYPGAKSNGWPWPVSLPCSQQSSF
ncbi:ATPase component of general energizing module of ECF transporters [Agrilactobacillus composti DSM 18527 = JCM 14202]|nr:ATPase component of general energizing module of ECF transporters [Agrilactobacillus composti DSM 18527 = JCM 14202]